MKICIVIDDYLPKSIKVAGKMMHELAIELKKLGHSVTVITPDDSIAMSFTENSLDGIEIIRFRSGKTKNNWKPIRLINELSLSRKAKSTLRNWINANPHDLVVFYSPTIFFSGIVSYLKSVWNCKSFLILRDFFPQWVIDNGMLKENSLLVKFFKYFEKRMYQVADKIGIQSPANIQWFKENFPEFFDKTTLLYNWASEIPLVFNSTGVRNFNSIEKQFTRSSMNLDNKIIFFYGGNIGKAQHMRNLINLAEVMRKEDEAFFIFLGAGDEYSYVREQIKERNLYNCLLLPSISQEEYLSFLNEVDIGLISLHPNHKTHNFPGKILSYLQKGLPILGVVNVGNDIVSLIHGAGAGSISTSTDSNDLYLMGKKMLSKKVRIEMSLASKTLLQDQFSVFKAAQKVLS